MASSLGNTATSAPAQMGFDMLLPSPHDQAEMAIYRSYEQQLKDHRMMKSIGMGTSPVGAVKHEAECFPNAGTLAIRRASDGTLKVDSAPEPQPSRYSISQEVKEEPPQACPPKDSVMFDDLDPYTKAAIEPLQKRDDKKK